MDDCMANFPEDIVKEILPRCPVKSLLRFKCVCKKWYALTKTTEFIQQHLKNRSPPQLLIYDNGDICDDSCSITLISEEKPQKFIGMKHLLGSVDGLFFMVGTIDRHVSCALWNPATRLHLPIPVAKIHDEPVFGFGLNPLTNDYKVVYFNYNHLSEYYAAFYSCSRDSWRIFKPNIPFFTDVNHTFGTAYLNGAYYSLLTGGRRSNYTILLFDFGSEMFEEIEGPDRQSVYTFVLGLMLIDDSIAILNYNPCSMFEYDIWVMNQPGVWNKLVTFQCLPLIKSCYGSSLILATRASQLVSYNVRTNKTRHLGFQHSSLRNGTEYGGSCGVFCYKESLVTIKRREDEELDH